MSIQEILEFQLFQIGDYGLTVHSLVVIALIYIVLRVMLWLTRKAINRRFRKLDKGSEYAIFLMAKYLLWVIAIVLVIETLGFKITIILAGSAALLVGIGLGLQQTFNDIVSGIILLMEGSTKVGDVLQVDGDVVRVLEIGLRASKVVNRDDIIIIIPNSLIVTNKVINWTHQQHETRFRVNVGVAYGSDVNLVLKLLEEAALEQPSTSNSRKPEARFLDFGESSLDFAVFFWSKEMFTIERTLSDMRRSIDAKFREHSVTIPFPQRDIHFRSSNVDLK